MHGLRTCDDGDYFAQRDGNTLFLLEQFGFYDAITPLVQAFATHEQESLFLDLADILHRHWADGNATDSE